MARGRSIGGATQAVFPLRLAGRYLFDAAGRPFTMIGDTPWCLEVQCTRPQIDAYLDHRLSIGVNAIMVECFEHLFSSQTPAYRNAADSADPFSTMSPIAWTSPTDTYWRTVDYIVNGAFSRGIAVILFPAYLGYNGGSEGWNTDVQAASDADLQAYGVFLARRYRQGNVIWCAGGDYAGANTTERDKQYQIFTGIRSVATDQIITGHPARVDVTAYSKWNGYAGFSLNSVYIPTTNIADDRCATAYDQAMPFFMIEGGYEGEVGTAATIRMSVWQSLCSGACGHFFGNNPLWGFGEPNNCGGAGAAATLAGSLNSTAAQQQRNHRALTSSYDFSKLVPKTDASLVSSSLGTTGTAGRVCPALSSDGSFAIIWTPSVAVTVVMSNFRQSSVRGRWFDPADGSFAAVSGSPFANSGSQTMTPPGDRVLVLD